MKKLLALLVLATIAVFPGCNSSTGDDDNGGNNNGGNNNGGNSTSASSYLPFKTGNTWTFTSTDNYGHTATSVETVIGATTINGKSYWMMQSDDSDFADTTYFRVADNTLYEILDSSDFADFGGSVAKNAKIAAALKAAVSTDTEVAYAKFGVSAGTTWTIYEFTMATGGKYSIKGKYVGLETVNTSAGNFANCAKFEITSGYSMTVEGVSTSMTDTSAMWFAPGVGPVKFSNNMVSSYGGQSYTYSSSEVLKSYSLK